MRDQIASRLAPLAPDVYEFADESHLHIGHAGNKGGGHYAILVVSNVFNGMNRVANAKCKACWQTYLAASKSTRSASSRKRLMSIFRLPNAQNSVVCRANASAKAA